MTSADGSPQEELDGPPQARRLGKADVHIHSIASDGTASAAEILEYAEDYAAGLSVQQSPARVVGSM